MKAFFMYAAIAVAATAFFFFLHHLGNQLPYELAKQRFETAFKEGNLGRTYSPHSVNRNREVPNPITVLGGISRFAECQISLMTLRAAQQQINAGGAFFDAVLLKSFERAPAGAGYCGTLASIVLDDAELGDRVEKTRYWWGGKALQSLALRYFSVFEIREMMKIMTYFAYLLLAVFLLQFYPRISLLFSPLIVFGFFTSGIQYFPNVAFGLPYLWAVLSAVALVFLTGQRAPAQTLKLFCFIVGAISSYLWLHGQSHIFITAFIGLFTYFATGRMKFAVTLIVLYMAGFLACFMLGQLVKIFVYEWLINDPVLWSGFYAGKPVYESGWVTDSLLVGGLLKIAGTTVDRFGGLAGLWSPHSLLRIEFLRAFWDLGLGAHYTAAKTLTVFSALAFIGSVGFAAVEARRGRPEVFRDLMFVVGIMVFLYVQFLLPSDNSFRAGRYMFLPYALCWLSLILVIMDRRRGGNPGAVNFRRGEESTLSAGNGKHGAA